MVRVGRAFGLQDFPTEGRGIGQAKTFALRHVGIITWSRTSNRDIGEYGEPTTLFQSRSVPDMK